MAIKHEAVDWDEEFDQHYPDVTVGGKPYGTYIKNFIFRLLAEQLTIREAIVVQREKERNFNKYQNMRNERDSAKLAERKRCAEIARSKVESLNLPDQVRSAAFQIVSSIENQSV